MIKITLEMAQNGVIKTIFDDNINGAGEMFENKTVYEIEDNGEIDDYDSAIRFLIEMCDDLGIVTGNKRDKKVLRFNVEWGEGYEPNKKEIEEKIKTLELDISLLKEYLKSYD